MERRTFLAGAAVAAMGLGVKSAAADRLPLGDLPNWRYPDPRVEVLDPRFKVQGRQCHHRAHCHRLPVGRRAGLYPRLSPAHLERHSEQSIMSWNEEDGHVSVFRQPSNYSNGNTGIARAGC